ncbi:LacI family transcription regulator [Weissella minor]|uniref:LacI family transcription regulator n=2 Tax=Weissella minor TaxID=1620 RepID=A0A0R2JFM9_9LACO|nr:LacI family transcription regulator [Weissella minor]
MNMEKKITISDIAKKANVSKSTVSRYLNGGSVSKTTREKIDELVATYNYQPNTFAQSLKSKRNHTVGVIVPRLDSAAQVEMLRGLDSENTDDTFLIVNTYQDSNRELAEIEKMRTQNVRGLIILTANMTDEIRNTLLESDMPIVVQGQDESAFNRVLMNDLAAGEAVGAYARSLNPKRVLLLTIPAEHDWAIGHDRTEGIKNALSDIDVTTLETDFSITQSKALAQAAMTDQSFDLIIGATDRIVVGALQAGLESGQQAKYIGFGKSDISTTVTPNLTSFEYDFFHAGQQLYRLFNQVCDDSYKEPQRIVLDGELIERASTKSS